MTAQSGIKTRGNPKIAGAHSKHVLNALTVKNPFLTWVDEHKIDLNQLAVLSGIRPYRLRALYTGLFMPHLSEAIQLERVSGATLPVSAWLEVPVVEQALRIMETNAGQPMRNWLNSRPTTAIWMHDSVYEALEKLFVAWREARELEGRPI